MVPLIYIHHQGQGYQLLCVIKYILTQQLRYVGQVSEAGVLAQVGYLSSYTHETCDLCNLLLCELNCTSTYLEVLLYFATIVYSQPDRAFPDSRSSKSADGQILVSSESWNGGFCGFAAAKCSVRTFAHVDIFSQLLNFGANMSAARFLICTRPVGHSSGKQGETGEQQGQKVIAPAPSKNKKCTK